VLTGLAFVMVLSPVLALARLFRDRGRPGSLATAWCLTALALSLGIAVSAVVTNVFQWNANLISAASTGAGAALGGMWRQLKRIDTAEAVMLRRKGEIATG